MSYLGLHMQEGEYLSRSCTGRRCAGRRRRRRSICLGAVQAGGNMYLRLCSSYATASICSALSVAVHILTGCASDCHSTVQSMQSNCAPPLFIVPLHLMTFPHHDLISFLNTTNDL